MLLEAAEEADAEDEFMRADAAKVVPAPDLSKPGTIR
jgi:hypothetical protein